MTAYADFLASKRTTAPAAGAPVDPGELHPVLRDFQRDIVAWAVARGRAALWTTTGTGKTIMQAEWLRHSVGDGRRGLILDPLAVCQQTVREAADKLDLPITYAPDGDTVARGEGLFITNYERADRMPAELLDGVVLDEGSILRDSTGRTRNLLIEHFARVPRRLSCTATPAPNQAEELTNQAEFVGAMTRVDMLASFYIHDQNGWRPKGHARAPMYDWMAQWAVALRHPSDLGYDDTGFDLPGLDIIPEIVTAHVDPGDALFAAGLGGVGDRARVRRETLGARCARVVELVDREPDEPWVLWCGLNDEATTLARDLGDDATNVHGGMSPEEKAELLLAFADGQIRYLITKPSIASRGLNWQHCARHAAVGLSDSYEDYFQMWRRSYRFGQTRRVHAHVVLSEVEQQIAANVLRKEREHLHAEDELVRAMRRARGLGAAA